MIVFQKYNIDSIFNIKFKGITACQELVMESLKKKYDWDECHVHNEAMDAYSLILTRLDWMGLYKSSKRFLINQNGQVYLKSDHKD